MNKFILLYPNIFLIIKTIALFSKMKEWGPQCATFTQFSRPVKSQ